MKKLLLICLTLSMMMACQQKTEYQKPLSSDDSTAAPIASMDTSDVAQNDAEEKARYEQWLEDHKIEIQPNHILIDVDYQGRNGYVHYTTLDTLTGFYYQF